MKRFIVLILLCTLFPSPAWAFEFWQLWQRPDQHEASIISLGNRSYRAGEWSQAEATYAESNSPRASYNRGNALAHVGNIQAAIAAYEDALRVNPQDADAKYNRDLLKQLPPQSSSSKTSPKLNPASGSPSPAQNTPSPPPPSRAEQQEQSERWLNQVADDPGGLLKQKFLRDHQKQLVEGHLP